MVKRPLVLLTLFYLFGILAGKIRLPFAILFPLFLLFSLPFFLNKKFLSLLIPLCFAAGFLLYQRAVRQTALEQYVQSPKASRVCGEVLSFTQGQNGGRMVVRLRVMDGAPEEVEKEKLLVSIPSGELFAPGSTVILYGEWMALSRGDNPGQFDEYSYYKAQGICAKGTAKNIELIGEKKFSSLLWRWKQKIKQVYSKVLPQAEAGVLEAMFLAEKGGLLPEIKEMYRGAGFSHILAVSGLHMSLLGMGFYKLLKKLRVGSNKAVVAACVLVLVYSIFAGAGIPIVRAAVMLFLSLFSAPLGKTYDAPTGLSAAALLLLVREPLQLFQAGFLLSFGAVVGILLFSKIFEKMGIKKLGASLGVQFVLLPLLFWFYYEVPVYALLLNLLVVPFLSLLLLLAIFIGVFGSFWLFFGKFFAGGAFVLLKGYEAICHLNEYLPGKRFCYGKPALFQMVLYYALLLLFYLICRAIKEKKIFPVASVFLLLLVGVFLLPRSTELTVTYLSVGQGDCAVLQKGSTTALVDAGSSIKNGAERVLIPYLKYHGDTEIEYVLLSHMDDDHCSMLLELLDAMAEEQAQVVVGTILLAAAAQKEEEKYALICEKAARAGVPCILFSAGDQLSFGGEKLICLSPQKGEDFGDANQNSMVLALCEKDALCLFTGDIAAAQEKKVIRALEECGLLLPGQARYLKTAHHGSRYSSSEEFLQLFSGQSAIISCGEKNRYKHPHKETLKRMEAAKIAPIITWKSGAVRVGEGKLYQWKPYLLGEGAWR